MCDYNLEMCTYRLCANILKIKLCGNKILHVQLWLSDLSRVECCKVIQHTANVAVDTFIIAQSYREVLYSHIIRKDCQI